MMKFQHTAARRRLVKTAKNIQSVNGFNTQPPEGGWRDFSRLYRFHFLFQHTAARRRLGNAATVTNAAACCFNTQPPEGGW